MQTKQTKLVLIVVLIQVVSVRLQLSSIIETFTSTYIRLCLRPEFIRSPEGVVPGINLACARACSASPRCRAFRLDPDSGQCRNFEFDSCSHRSNLDGCSQFGWAFVRRLSGLSDGRLCPDGYGSRHFTSTYRLFPVASWSDGLNVCQAQLGLTKFADGNDQPEVDHLHWIKTNVNSGQPYFVGGHRIGSFASGTWFWHRCNTSFLPEVWMPGQPNDGDSYYVTNIWTSHVSGIDDVTNSYPGISKALCECVNPFE